MEAVITAVHAAIDDLNSERPEKEQLIKAETTVLSGAGAVLDSLGLVTFIVAVEQQIQSGCGAQISLNDDGLFFDANAVVTVSDLVGCVSRLVTEAAKS